MPKARRVDSLGCEACEEAGLKHADYPHDPGYLFDCLACEDHCHCGRADGKAIQGQAACVFGECNDDEVFEWPRKPRGEQSE